MESVVAQYSGAPIVREATVRLLPGIANNDIRAQVLIVVQWVKDHVTYVRDPDGAEYLVTPVQMLQNYQTSGFMAGDCDDHVILLNTMLGSIGIPTKCVGVKFGSSPEFNHVISGVKAQVGNYQRVGDLSLIDPCAKGKMQQVYNQQLIV